MKKFVYDKEQQLEYAFWFSFGIWLGILIGFASAVMR
jgi:hypothetical protein